MVTGIKTVVGLFDSLEEAQFAVRELQQDGFGKNDINLIAQATSVEYGHYFDSAGRYASPEAPPLAETDASTGAGVGASLGALAGLLIGLSMFALPGVGPIMVAGPLASALLGATAGGITGGLVTGLTDAGVPEEHAGVYTEGVRRGGTLVLVKALSQKVMRATDILNRHNPVDVQERTQRWKSDGWQAREEATAK